MKQSDSEYLHSELRRRGAYANSKTCEPVLCKAAAAFTELAQINANLAELAVEDSRIKFLHGRVSSLLYGEAAPSATLRKG